MTIHAATGAEYGRDADVSGGEQNGHGGLGPGGCLLGLGLDWDLNWGRIELE